MPEELAYIFIAVSSQPQAAEDKISLAEQERACREMATRHGRRVVKVLSLPGYSRNYITLDDAIRDMQALRPPITTYRELRELIDSPAPFALYAYTGNRLGRTLTLVSEIMLRLIQARKKLFLVTGGEVTEDTVTNAAAMYGFEAQFGIRKLVGDRRRTMDKYTSIGIPNSSKLPMTHMRVRNDRGKTIGIAINPAMRRFLDDLATLLLEGVSWTQMGNELKNRFGHVGRAGRAHDPNMAIRLFYNPILWGNMARHHSYRRGLWVFDSSEPVPEGVIVHYGVIRDSSGKLVEAWPGELGEQVKAELRRRHFTQAGSQQPKRAYRFAGLILCGNCGHVMRAVPGREKGVVKRINYYCMRSRLKEPRGTGCPNRRILRESTAKHAFEQVLQNWIDRQNPDQFIVDQDEESVRLEQRRATLTHEIEKAGVQIARLIALQLEAPASSQADYQLMIGQKSESRELMQRELAQLAQAVEESPDVIQRRRNYYEELRHNGIGSVWKNDNYSINQELHSIMGSRRLIAIGDEIVGLGTVGRAQHAISAKKRAYNERLRQANK